MFFRQRQTGQGSSFSLSIGVLVVLLFALTVALPKIGRFYEDKRLAEFAAPLGSLGAKVWPSSLGFEIIPIEPNSVTDEVFVSWVPHLNDERVIALNLAGTRISSESLESLTEKNINNIEILDISGTDINDLHAIASFGQLRVLAIDGGSINSSSVETLRNCGSLKRLFIRQGDITEETSRMLSSVSSIEHVEFVKCLFTDGALASLKRQRPDLRIVMNDGAGIRKSPARVESEK